MVRQFNVRVPLLMASRCRRPCPSPELPVPPVVSGAHYPYGHGRRAAVEIGAVVRPTAVLWPSCHVYVRAAATSDCSLQPYRNERT